MAKVSTENQGNAEQIVIRPMQLSDLQQVLAIEVASFPAPWSRQAFVSELTYNRMAVYLVARSQNQVVGYAGMWLVVDEAHVTNIAVHLAWRRLGIGKQLMDRLQDLALARGCTAMTLEVRKSNFAAQNLYTQYGFAAQGLRRGYYADTGEDAIVMWKQLEEAP